MTTMWPIPAAVAPLPTTSRSSTATDRPADASSSAQAVPTMPAPTISTSGCSATVYAPPERIVRIEHELAFERDVCRPGDAWPDVPIFDHIAGLEAAADYTLLDPWLAGSELAVGGQASQLRAGARSTWRAVVRLARTEHEITGVGVVPARTDELDVIDRSATYAGHSRTIKRRADAPGKVRQMLDLFEAQILPMIVDQEEPVAAPGHVSGDLPIPLDLDGDLLCMTKAGHIIDSHAPIFEEARRHRTHRRFNAMLAHADPAKIGERGHEADGAMAAHSQVGNVVEENDARGAGRIARFAEWCPNQDIRPARLVNH